MPYEPSAAWQYDVPTTGSTHLPPDAGYGKALTNQGYGFEVAVADLIDNSLDAGADEMVVHFLRDAERILTLLVIDNGRSLDDAMTVGKRRDYDDDSLGMYGTGLKAASLSHASSLTVVSRTRRTRAAGRRLTAEGIEDGSRCDTVDPRRLVTAFTLSHRAAPHGQDATCCASGPGTTAGAATRSSIARTSEHGKRP